MEFGMFRGYISWCLNRRFCDLYQIQFLILRLYTLWYSDDRVRDIYIHTHTDTHTHIHIARTNRIVFVLAAFFESHIIISVLVAAAQTRTLEKRRVTEELDVSLWGSWLRVRRFLLGGWDSDVLSVLWVWGVFREMVWVWAHQMMRKAFVLASKPRMSLRVSYIMSPCMIV